ncbi:hypothetical protein KYC5002_38730 [Archangium violaceum]|nr:hypothetical protein KYC5002_38730 [Archangium gephyra]
MKERQRLLLEEGGGTGMPCVLQQLRSTAARLTEALSGFRL